MRTHEVEREWWMSDVCYRSYQLDGQAYQLWSAKRNPYHEGCYTLTFAVSDGEKKLSGFTYFYENPQTATDNTLEQAVNEVLSNLRK